MKPKYKNLSDRVIKSDTTCVLVKSIYVTVEIGLQNTYVDCAGMVCFYANEVLHQRELKGAN